MSIFYRIIIIILILAAGYSLYGIFHFQRMYYKASNPHAEFQIAGNQQSDVTLIEFMNYGCGYCKQLNPVVKELLEVRKDIRYIARPISFKIFEGEEGKEVEVKDKLTKIAFAAGLQGKFWEMHDALLEYPETQIPDSFIEETALLYGLDYDRLIKDSDGKEVQKIIGENISTFDHIGLYSVPAFMIKDKIYVITEENLPDLKQLLDMIATAEKSS